MKKIKLDINRPYRLPDPKISNEMRLKKIYDNSFQYSKQKSPRNSIKKETQYRYGMFTDRKYDDARQSKYDAYLQGQYMRPKQRPNRRYEKKIQINKQKQKESSDFSSYVGDISTRKRNNGQSVDMFKIRKAKQKITDRKMSVSHSKINNHPLNQFQQAKQLYKKSKFKEALQLFNACIQKKPERPDYQYYTAICQLNLHNYQQGYKILQNICQLTPNFKKSAFLFAAISAKHLQKYSEAQKLCDEGLALYPNYADLLSYRAKLLQRKGKYQLAHKDYQLILKEDKSNIDILLSDAQCLYHCKSYANCLNNLSAALYADKGQYRSDILYRRIQINLEIQNIKQVKKDILKVENLKDDDRQCSKMLYIKGLILSKEGKKRQSILCFEQSLKAASSKDAMAKSLVQIAKNKINQRDFYSAFHNMNRSKTLQLQSDEIKIYGWFSEGVVNLMKRKIKEGDNFLQKIIEYYPNLTPYLKKIFYLYRAFAKFSLSQYKQAITNYEAANNQEPLDIYGKYNKLLAQGISNIQQKQYQQSVKILNQAQKILSFTNLNRIQAYLYRAAAHIEKAKDYMKIQHEMEQLKSLQQIFSALKQLDKANDLNDSNSNMLYFRGLIYLYLGKNQQALQDILKAISKSQQNVAKYFFFRGLTHASLGNTKQALNDFSICTNLDQNFHLVYLHKAKINFQNNNITKALEDLVKLKSLLPNQDIKYHQTCLNYVYGHYVMANVCCDDIVDPQLANKMKILIKLKLGKIKQVSKLVKTKGDKMMCDIMLGNIDDNQASSNQLQYFSLYHYHHNMGIRHFKKQQYQEAVNMFLMAIKQRNLVDLQQGIANHSLSQAIDQQQENQDENLDSQKDIIHKINYNIFICYLLNKQYKKAYEVFIRDIISAKHSLLKNQFIAAFSHALFEAISCKVQPQQKQIYELSLFQSKIDKISESLLIQLPTLFIKTKICYLTIHDHKLDKQYSPKADPEFIIQYINLKEIQNRPEPPWVKRQDSGLIFTDEITNINVQFMTTENDEQEQQQQDQGNSQEDDQEYRQQQESNDNNNNISVNKFKQKMKLGDSIERKLQMIMERKKKKQIQDQMFADE